MIPCTSSFSRKGRNWAACTTEGLLIYSLDDDWLFDPLQLEESNTPNSVRRKIQNNNYSTGNVYMYLFIRLQLRLALLVAVHQCEEERQGRRAKKRKEIGGQRVEPHTQIDALIGDKKKTGKSFYVEQSRKMVLDKTEWWGSL